MEDIRKMLEEVIKEQLKPINDKLESIEIQIKAISEQTADLFEFREEVSLGLNEISENQKSLFEMYGAHEVAIRNLKRRPV